jgi:hypothetical protein
VEPWTLITQLFAAVREFVAPSYRPELHYMRGPGPKWRAKYAITKPR